MYIRICIVNKIIYNDSAIYVSYTMFKSKFIQYIILKSAVRNYNYVNFISWIYEFY